MIIKDNTNYEEIYEIFQNNVKKDRKNYKQYTMQSILIVIISILLFISTILGLNKLKTFTDEQTIDELMTLAFSIICLVSTIICIIFSVWKVADTKSLKEKIKKANVITSKNISIKDKLLEIEKEFSGYYIDYVNIASNLALFNFASCKILNAIYILNNSYTLNIVYVKDNEVLTKKVPCVLHMYENLDEPEIAMEKKGATLSIKYISDLPDEIDFSNETWRVC